MDRSTRLILWNQFEILKLLDPTNAKDYDLKQDIVGTGYATQYSDVYTNISDQEASADMQRETLEVLEMFRALYNAELDGWKPSDPTRTKFGGFDGNNDDHYFFAQFLLDQRGLYTESAPARNSHSSATIERYRRMISAWKKAANRYHLTETEAEAILAAVALSAPSA